MLITTLRTIAYTLFAFLIFSCAGSRQRAIKKNWDTSLEENIYANMFNGILVLDPVSGDTLYKKNTRKYFTPASNTKIFTLYAALTYLPEYMPSLEYTTQGDTLYFRGMADPSLLHPYFQDSTALQMLRHQGKLSLVVRPTKDQPWGPGWAWEDYDSYYSPDRSSFPMYGNVAQIWKEDSVRVIPGIFRKNISTKNKGVNRLQDQNTFFYPDYSSDTLLVPFRTSDSLTLKLLGQALGKEIHLAQHFPLDERKILYSIPTDSILMQMMQESDNFLAEQLLLAASLTIADTVNTQLIREQMLNVHLNELRDKPRWVDGSGLSRYNLFTPESMVAVLHRLYREVPRERLLSWFPAGGVSGTLQDWFGAGQSPYLYAKTGSLGNNYCLSGYLYTRSGKLLIFSYMNNHFRVPSAVLKSEMQAMFAYLRDTY
ncbi:D-alanyl-D-alanine carboxypeptidase [Zeaxanthinibacter sp. PT1]|uniref:D-alanyl-D-alanine carboxypeptidase/D-alanyl-D-alanine-endopeptidase n=1 Tax=Zeaxanthinibacter TaxID=561554 RepID=UPI0023493904|nr:D-alanyl-D-alanine carboxypeptidase [Zeaxanthinibacter sp. PT1]MDC6352239.1 D-alanyl-D-alanine carboxypeptidase [Zeaxanthinibacter sp. PT1]